MLRKRVKSSAQQARQAAGRDLRVPRRHAGGAGIDLAGPRKQSCLRKRATKESQNSRFALDETAATARNDLAEARRKHHLVADPLFAVDQDGLGRIRLAVPFGLGEDARLGVVAPAPLIVAPTLFEKPLPQEGQGAVESREGRVWFETQRAIVGGLRWAEESLMVVRVCQIGMRLEKIGPQAGRF